VLLCCTVVYYMDKLCCCVVLRYIVWTSCATVLYCGILYGPVVLLCCISVYGPISHSVRPTSSTGSVKCELCKCKCKLGNIQRRGHVTRFKLAHTTQSQPKPVARLSVTCCHSDSSKLVTKVETMTLQREMTSCLNAEYRCSQQGPTALSLITLHYV
jgi:hypothetical protein